jgi:hypothetical protein
MRTAKKIERGKEWLRDKPEKYERDSPYPRRSGKGPLSADPIFVEIPDYEQPTEQAKPQPKPKK